MNQLLALENTIQNYAWGSTRALAEFLGRPNPTHEPQAELWIGAHPKAPSRVVGANATLADLVREAPGPMLGDGVARRYGELPFLLKVIAAAEPLSIQCHPNLEQARAGYAREEKAGIPKTASERNYRDANHKPELIVAMGPFTALKGFRPAEEIAKGLGEVGRPELEREIDRLAAERSSAALRGLFGALLSLGKEARTSLLARAAQVGATRDTLEWEWVRLLAEKYPGDVGALSPLLLNLVELVEGEGMFLGPGELHAYLEGTGIELMANSDNVLRGGLTPKHVDLQELLAIGRFEPAPPGVIRGELSSPQERRYPTPAREFDLAFVDVAPDASCVSGSGHGVQVLLGVEGEMTAECGGTLLPLGRGQAVFVPAALPGYVVRGRGRLARACVPREA